MANVGPAQWYAGSVQWTAVAAWAATTAYTIGRLVRQATAPTVGNERVFVCVVAGTSLGSEPPWNVGKGAVTTDNTISWQECTGQPAVNGESSPYANTPTWVQQHTLSATVAPGLIIQDSASGSVAFWTILSGVTIGASAPAGFSTATAGTQVTDNAVTWVSLGLASTFITKWSAPFARLQSVFAAGNAWAGPGHILWIADNHAETQSTNMDVPGNGSQTSPNYVYSVDHTTALPPTGSNLSDGATVTTTGSGHISLLASGGNGFIRGMTFQCGSGANNPTLQVGSSAGSKLVNCKLQKLGTNASVIGITFSNFIELVNTTLKFGAIGDNIRANGAWVRWRDTPNAIDISGPVPTTLFINTGLALIELDGLDLSALGSGTLNSGVFVITSVTNCVFSGIAAAPPALPNRWGGSADLIFTDSIGSTETHQRAGTYGVLKSTTVVYRTGGASNGVVNWSWNISTNTFPLVEFPFESFASGIWNTVTLTNRIVTMYGWANAAALPTNAQAWMEVRYLGDSGSPITSIASTGVANGLAAGTTLTADSTSVWNAPARVANTAYIAGTSIIQATGLGSQQLIWVCTTSGTSASSLPAGYATTTDGGSVTDGTAVFRAVCRFAFTVTLNAPQPQLVGSITTIIKIAQPSTIYGIDPPTSASLS